MKKPAVLLLLGASAVLYGFGPSPVGPSVSDAARPRRPKIREVRVSFDVLEPDGSSAQPETQAEPFVAVNPRSEAHLVAGYQEARFADGGARALTYAVSRDGGRTWSEGLIPGLTRANGGRYPRASDPWVAFGPGGQVYYASIAFDNGISGVFVSASADGGDTWGNPAVVHLTSSSFDDKPALTVDTREDSPWQGRVYVPWINITNRSQAVVLSYSADEGASFSRPVAVFLPGINVGPVPLVGPGGIVHLIWFHAEASLQGRLVSPAIWSARSEDGGETWSAPVEVARMSLAGVPYLRTGAILPAAAVDGSNGSLYVVWQDGRETNDALPQVFLAVSGDAGQTWSEPRLVSDGPRDVPNHTPSVAVNGDGVVAIAYTSFRNDPVRGELFDEYIAFSRDGGATFRPSQRLSTQSTYGGVLAYTDEGYFQGDYQGLAAGPRVFYRTWVAALFAPRNDPKTRQPDVFTLAVEP